MPLEEISALRGRGFIFSLELQAQIPPTRNSVSSSTHYLFLTLGPVRHPALRNPALTPVLPPTLLTRGPPISGPPPQGQAARAKAETRPLTYTHAGKGGLWGWEYRGGKCKQVGKAAWSRFPPRSDWTTLGLRSRISLKRENFRLWRRSGKLKLRQGDGKATFKRDTHGGSGSAAERRGGTSPPGMGDSASLFFPIVGPGRSVELHVEQSVEPLLSNPGARHFRTHRWEVGESSYLPHPALPRVPPGPPNASPTGGGALFGRSDWPDVGRSRDAPGSVTSRQKR